MDPAFLYPEALELITVMVADFPLVSVNGQLGAMISPLDRAFAYGDGVFETCRVRQGRIPLWDYHVQRLTRACSRLSISFDPQVLAQYQAELFAHPALRQLDDAVFKLVVSRGLPQNPQLRGYRIAGDYNTTYCLSLTPAKPLQAAQYLQGVRLRVCNLRLASSPLLAGLKHLNRLEQVLARSEWADEYDEGLLLDQQGSVIEATSANIFIRVGGRWLTPDLSTAGVAGVMRQYLLEQLLPEMGEGVDVVTLNLADLAAAEEVFVCNSVMGIWPVLSIQGIATVWQPGVQTRRLQAVLGARFE